MVGQYATIAMMPSEIAYSIMMTHEDSINAMVPTIRLQTAHFKLYELQTRYTLCLCVHGRIFEVSRTKSISQDRAVANCTLSRGSQYKCLSSY